MDIRQLRTTLAIAETGSLTRAAELLHVVQPALSRQLRQLEDELGVPLFERNRLGMTLTERGRRFIDQVRVSLQTLDQARAAIAAPAASLCGTVSIGMLPSLAATLAAPLATALQRQYPEVKVRIAQGFSHALQVWLELGELDIAVMGDYRPSDLLYATPVWREPLQIVGRPRPQYGWPDADTLALARAARLPLIMPAAHQGLRHLIHCACTAIGADPNIVAESDDTNIQLDMARHGVGFAILPASAIAPALAPAPASGRLTAAAIIGPTLHRTLVIGRPVAARNPLVAQTLQTELICRLKPLADAQAGAGLQWCADDTA